MLKKLSHSLLGQLAVASLCFILSAVIYRLSPFHPLLGLRLNAAGGAFLCAVLLFFVSFLFRAAAPEPRRPDRLSVRAGAAITSAFALEPFLRGFLFAALLHYSAILAFLINFLLSAVLCYILAGSKRSAAEEAAAGSITALIYFRNRSLLAVIAARLIFDAILLFGPAEERLNEAAVNVREAARRRASGLSRIWPFKLVRSIALNGPNIS